MDSFALTSQVLRDPDAVAQDDDPRALARLAPPLLAMSCGGAMLLGLAAGATSGPLQSAYAAVKTPALFLLPPLLALPLVQGFATACGVRVSWTRLGIATLAGLARSGLLAAAVAPLLWLPFSLHADYHLAVLLFVGAFALSILPGLATVARAVPSGGTMRLPAVLGTLLVLGIVTAQTGWVLRPFVARPRAEVTFLRPVEADVFSSLGSTARSASGDYREDWAPRGVGLWRE
jgi:hypothetical protein